ncbi:MAG: anthranilate synthase component I family protein [Candidatus Omnitrophota bacterium]|nr:anthranilate synthase component I family protein [Candidatus Omnitrophota bacterium]
MPPQTPRLLRYGPLSVYVTSREGCVDLQAFIQQTPPSTPVVWCDSARPHAMTGRWSILGCDPWLTLFARGDRIELRTSAATRVWREHPLTALRQVLRRYRVPASAGPHGRAIGLMGWLSYDLNRWIEALPPPQPAGMPMPEMGWFGMQTAILVDHVQRRSWLLRLVDPHAPGPLAHREALEALEWTIDLLAHRPDDPSTTRTGQPDAAEEVLGRQPLTVQPTCTQAEFETMVSRALEFIRAGDIFQANVSQQFTTLWEGRPLSLYLALRRINPSPFACFLSCEALTAVSCSPERLVRIQDGRVDTRPIAGTRPRGQSAEEDLLNSLELFVSEKERAEHIMLVDLARNDLGRIAATGSVGVEELMTLEAYSHVIHIVSNVSGRLRRGVDAVEAIRAVFPGGTITGCPKVRCMQILRELEPVARGLYTGSLGYIGFDGTMDLSIAIRTLVLQGRRLSFHVGAGIVADSVPEREYHETLAKAGALLKALGQDHHAAVG